MMSDNRYNIYPVFVSNVFAKFIVYIVPYFIVINLVHLICGKPLEVDLLIVNATVTDNYCSRYNDNS